MLTRSRLHSASMEWSTLGGKFVLKTHPPLCLHTPTPPTQLSLPTFIVNSMVWRLEGNVGRCGGGLIHATSLFGHNIVLIRTFLFLTSCRVVWWQRNLTVMFLSILQTLQLHFVLFASGQDWVARSQWVRSSVGWRCRSQQQSMMPAANGAASFCTL